MLFRASRDRIFLSLPLAVATYLVVKEGPVHTLERKDSLLNVHWGENYKFIHWCNKADLALASGDSSI